MLIVSDGFFYFAFVSLWTISIMTNQRNLVSRNKREGKYIGKYWQLNIKRKRFVRGGS